MYKKEIKILNTIRGIAALMVVISHYSNATKLFDRILGSGGGQVGVMLFFILSGFLISYLYLDCDINKLEIKKYLIARIARVIPLFYFVVTISFCIKVGSDFSFLYKIENLSSFISHLIFIDGVSVLWTIPVEIQYYVLFIGIWGLFYINKVITFILIFCLCFGVFYFKPVLKIIFFGQEIDFNILKAIPFFLTGLILGKVYPLLKELPKSRIWGLSIVLLFLIYPGIYQIILNKEITLWYSFITFLAVTIFFCVWVFMIPGNSKIFSNKIGDFMGKISYSMYLWHLPVIYVLKSYLRGSPLLLLPVYMFIVVVISYLSYLVIENPARSYIKSFNAYKNIP